MPSSFTKKERKLIAHIKKLVAHIQYHNAFIFILLKEVTLNKTAIIDLDNARLKLSASTKNGYTLYIKPVKTSTLPDFNTKADYLREIVNGVITLDQAISSNKILVRGTLENLLGIYRLAIGLLIEGPTSPHLRDIWNNFSSQWEQDAPTPFPSNLDQQQIYDYFSNLSISSEVKNVEINT